MTKRVLVTGANGFIGRSCVRLLKQKNYIVRGVMRDHSEPISDDIDEQFIINDLSGDIDWQPILRDVDVVIHLASRVHVLKETASVVDVCLAYDRINYQATVKLAEDSLQMGVKHFIYMSSIAAQYNYDKSAKARAYGEAKLKSEQFLLSLCNQRQFPVTIIRPPLVYGPGAKGNFVSLLKLCSLSIPLPFGSIDAKRSYINVENLSDILYSCLLNTQCFGKIYSVKDCDLSLNELICMVKKYMDKPSRLVPINKNLLLFFVSLVGMGGRFKKVTKSLIIDDRQIRKDISWDPPIDFRQGIAETVKWFQMNKVS
jgi:UDP-N-acetyl-alpha-D-quinovosamine dehydrogenase